MSNEDISTNNNIWAPLERKKRKFSETNDNYAEPVFVSATAIKNSLLNDPILDWCELHYDKNKNYPKPSDDKNQHNADIKTKKRKLSFDGNLEKDSLGILFSLGNEFEEKITAELIKQFGKENVLTIVKNGKFGLTRDNQLKTTEAMIKGYPFILQGVIYNDINNTYGIFDFIVRSDYINRLVKRQVLNEYETTIKAPKLSGSYHYLVVDIKWTSVTLCANGKNIRNENRFPCYKGQLAIYNYGVGCIQGYIPSKAYIMAKSWKIDSKKNYEEGWNCFDILPEIDYNGFDKQYIQKTADAIEWRRKVINEGKDWNPYYPLCPEMYPNMSNKNDAPYSKIKKDVADEISEITSIWGVTEKNRKMAHSKGIMSWKDPNCNSLTLGIGGDNKPNIIDEILETNRRKNATIRPKYIKNNIFKWKKSSPVDFYVDFETINMTLYTQNINLHNSKSVSDLVFMIGIGYCKDNNFVHKCFVVDKLTLNDENKLFTNFTEYLATKIQELDPKLEYVPRLFHWSSAEISNIKHVNNRHNNKFKSLVDENFTVWVDMYKIFVNEPITVKGSLSFKLKDVIKSMNNLGIIKTSWRDDGPNDGLGAMMFAIKYYQDINKKDDGNLKSIIDYNEVDCKVLYEMIEYLRNTD